MGIACAWIGCQRPAAELERAIPVAFPGLEVIERVEAASGVDFTRIHQRVADTRSQVLLALAFYDDGTNGVCVDESVTVIEKSAELGKLSELVGPTLVAYEHMPGGCAGYEFFQSGRSIRKVEDKAGDFAAQGEPLPQEAGILDEENYFSCEELWAACGMTRLPGDWEADVRLVLYRDHDCERDLDRRRLDWRKPDGPSATTR